MMPGTKRNTHVSGCVLKCARLLLLLLLFLLLMLFRLCAMSVGIARVQTYNPYENSVLTYRSTTVKWYISTTPPSLGTRERSADSPKPQNTTRARVPSQSQQYETVI